MPKHRKPSVKELDENLNESLKKIEEEEKEDEKPVVIPEEEEDEPIESPEEEEETPEPPKGEEKPPKGEVETLKKRYSDSSAEALVLHSKSKKMVEAIEKAGEVEEPTDEEMKKEYADWEVMSDFERKMAQNDLTNRRKLEAIAQVAKDFKDMESWNTKIDEFLTDPEVLALHPELEGQEGDFKIFSTKETRRGVDFEDLVSAFLYTQEGKPKPKNKGKMFEVGSGGISEKPKITPGKISHEEGQRLRILDYKKYIEMVRTDKIEAPEL
jgi:hypothetical protein